MTSNLPLSGRNSGGRPWQSLEFEDASRTIGINGLSPHGDAPIRKVWVLPEDYLFLMSFYCY